MVNEKRERLATSEDDASMALVDRISLLPEEVLGLILSFLTAKEAFDTRVLSRSWKHTWRCIRRMEFDGTHPSWKLRDNHTFKFIRWVDHALHQCLHQRSTLHEFRLRFYLYDDSLAHWVDDWLSYALTRKVETLELNLLTFYHNSTYHFPYNKRNFFPDDLKPLKKLFLHFVRVSGQAVKFLIANCPLLEHLSVCGTFALDYVDIDGSFASFKCLEISTCRCIQYIRVCNSKLVNIKYSGRWVPSVIIDNVPLLTQLWIRFSLDLCLKDGFQMFSSLLPQLEMCKICFTNYVPWEEYEDFIKSNLEMSKLKKLVVSIGEHYYDNIHSLLPIIHLLSVSPRLQKFVLQASHGKGGLTSLNTGPHICSNPRASRDRLLKEYRTTYFYFKEIEFAGYRGADTQLELIKILVDKYCIGLENITIDPRCFDVPLAYRPWYQIPRQYVEVERRARLSAHKQLKEDDAFSKINVNIL